MQSRPLVSVIVPLYNKEEYIVDTITSILQQSFADYEVLVVDDGSTDTSLDRVKIIQDKRVRVINQENQGVAVARNNGIKHAIGNWISFLDADDLWDKRFLEKMIALVHKYPEGEIFSSGRQLRFEDKITEYSNPYLPEKGFSSPVDYIKIIEKFFPPINSSSCLISREVLLQSGGFKPGMKNYEDHDLWIRLSHNRPIFFLNEPLSIYRKDVVANNSGSKCSLRASDFITYLETLKAVKASLKLREMVKGLEHYAFRFCGYNYLLNAQYFNAEERKKMRRLMKGVVGTGHYSILFTITAMSPFMINPFVRLYRNRKLRK